MGRPETPAREVARGGRLHLQVTGAVQGVGFRPFVYRLAGELGLAGSVLNDSCGVEIRIEGPEPALAAFRQRLEQEPPPLARILSVTESRVLPTGEREFRIVRSNATGELRALVVPDVATCPQCLQEVLDAGDRRHGYPFTNCTDCGPRFSIIRALPYDRPATTMAGFTMCRSCQSEYDEPTSRRFHAQPNACPVCGPRLSLVNRAGDELPTSAPIDEAVERLRCGSVVAIKGLGGFLLLVDATSGAAVRRLRRRKRRPRKPLAVMVAGTAMARQICHVDTQEETLLSATEAPIVLLLRHPTSSLAPEIAPDNPRVGVMLPTSPLHHLVSRAFGRPLVATSGNRSDEPICIDNDEALARLAPIADLFLMHDRPVARHVDDSVAWIFGGAPQTLRRARGLAPLPIIVSRPQPTVLAVGAQLKNTIALGLEDRVFISQHIGDMETPEALDAFGAVITDFIDLYLARPVVIAHDLHPDYASTQWAIAATRGAADAPAALRGLRRLPVQHHHAHLASCLAEHQADGRALGVIFDGAGLGTDDTIWGGEFLQGDASGYRRVARLRTFALPGADAAARDPRRPALALLHAIDRADKDSLEKLPALRGWLGAEVHVLRQMLDRQINSPATSSVGRLFDGVAAILGLASTSTFEGEAAMRLEFAAAPGAGRDYPLPLRPVATAPGRWAGQVGEQAVAEMLELDWGPLIEAIFQDTLHSVAPAEIAAGFHTALVGAVVEVVRRTGDTTVALSGGCFQNRRLQEQVLDKLTGAGIKVLIQRQIPPNDGGISLGQVVVAAARTQRAGAGAPAHEED